jgi:hypothetical protein
MSAERSSLVHNAVPFLIAIEGSSKSKNVSAPAPMNEFHQGSWKLKDFHAVTLVIQVQIL